MEANTPGVISTWPKDLMQRTVYIGNITKEFSTETLRDRLGRHKRTTAWKPQIDPPVSCGRYGRITDFDIKTDKREFNYAFVRFASTASAFICQVLLSGWF